MPDSLDALGLGMFTVVGFSKRLRTSFERISKFTGIKYYIQVIHLM